MIVRTPKRLHLGIIDPSGDLGRKFGSIGLALDEGYEIKITPAGGLSIEANEEDRKIIEKVVEEINLHYEIGVDFHIEVRRSIPRHVGLGSTTQLALGIASGILKLAKKDVPIEEVAKVLGRALKESPRSKELMLFRRQVESFFESYGKKIWGKSFDPDKVIGQFHKAAGIEMLE